MPFLLHIDPNGGEDFACYRSQLIDRSARDE